MEIKDQLSWNEFLKNSKNSGLVDKVQPYNRLIAHSKNLFVVAGYGAFTEGYVLIITKDFIPSFGLIEPDIEGELKFLIKILKYIILKKYNRPSVIFEHGMCACIGGLDRAHIHIMSTNKKTNSLSLKNSIEKVLYKRKAGIKHVKIGKYILENLHDINQFMDDPDFESTSDIEIKGKLLNFKDIKNLKVKEWPSITLNHINKGGHYVFFGSDFDEASFLTTQNFQTQFGRHVVFENEMVLSEDFRNKITQISKDNPLIEAWKWQSCMFEKNVINSVNSTRKSLKELKSEFSDEYIKFNIDII
jgi:hypothetical protein